MGRWLVREGDRVSKDQALVEILTDKADSEIPSPVGGFVEKIHVAVDAVVEVGAILCEISEAAVAAPAPMPAPAAPAASKPTLEASPIDAHPEPKAPSDAPTSPSVRRLAREHELDLGSVQGTGRQGRITQQDVRAAAVDRPAPGAPPPPAPPPAPPSLEAPAAAAAAAAPRLLSSPSRTGAFRLPPYVHRPGDEIVPFTRRRRIIADHMVYSKQTSPEVVTFAECDLDKTARLRDAHKKRYQKDGVSLTYMAFALAATARALREFPELNARVLDDAFVKLRDVNVGIAVDTEKGLVVPVVRDADDLTVRGLARSIADLALRAREGALTPDDLMGKTFTVSNPGRKGNLVGGAIISQPNVGILRLGTIKKRVVVVEGEEGDVMAIHPVMYMALTYDHRVVDGVHANGFLYRITEILEQGDFEV